jgi:hypothetical protein
MSEWETFCDVCYYDLWRVRRKDERGFNDGFHLQHGKEAKELVELLNKLERGEANAKLQEVSSKLADALRERDEARQALMKIEDLFVDGVDVYADREKMGLIARAALEGVK